MIKLDKSEILGVKTFIIKKGKINNSAVEEFITTTFEIYDVETAVELVIDMLKKENRRTKIQNLDEIIKRLKNI